jgi:hypothetical protein
MFVNVPSVLSRADWTWTPKGLQIDLSTDQGQCRVLVPIGHVETIFRNELAAVGCPMGPSVGAPGSTHGFLATVGATHELYVGGRRGRARRQARRAERRASRRRRGKRPFFKGKFFQGLGKAVKKVGTIAKKVVTNPVFRAGFSALSTAFPVLAPAAAGLEVASRVIKKIEKGKEAAKKLARGVIGDAGSLQQQVAEANQALQGIQELKALAERGDKDAQQALGELISAQAVMG